MRKVSSLLIFGLSLSLNACSTFEGYPEQSSLPPDSTLEVVDKELDGWVSKYESADQTERQTIRNNLLRRRLLVIDAAYEKFEQNIYVQNLRGTVYTDWATNLLTSAGPITDHIPTRNVLSGLSTALTGGKAVYESNVLAKGLMPALITEMRTSREEVRNKIRERSAFPVSQYDLYDALTDLNEYKVAGTVPNAIASINAQSSEDQGTVAARTDNSIRVSGLGTEQPYLEPSVEESAPVAESVIPEATIEPVPQTAEPELGSPPPSMPAASIRTTKEDFASWVQNPVNKQKLDAWLKPQGIGLEDFLTKDTRTYKGLRANAAVLFNVM